MDKRYQVFVSSTFNDLKVERQKVMAALMKMNCIPAGMEHFPASDEEQFNFIKKIIDDSDYYLLIIAGRYGSVDEEGISYTEKEFDYAVSKAIKVIAIIHENPVQLTVEKSETSEALKEKLERFKEKVKHKRVVEFWDNPSELESKVTLGILNAITVYPAIGWVRADKIANEQSLSDLIKAKDEITTLKNRILELEAKSGVSYTGKIADFDSKFKLRYTITPTDDYQAIGTEGFNEISWRDLYHFLSPFIYKQFTILDLFSRLTAKIDKDNAIPNDYYTTLNESDLMTIELQLTALGLITSNDYKWSLTAKGYDKMMDVIIQK